MEQHFRRRGTPTRFTGFTSLQAQQSRCFLAAVSLPTVERHLSSAWYTNPGFCSGLTQMWVRGSTRPMLVVGLRFVRYPMSIAQFLPAASSAAPANRNKNQSQRCVDFQQLFQDGQTSKRMRRSSNKMAIMRRPAKIDHAAKLGQVIERRSHFRNFSRQMNTITERMVAAVKVIATIERKPEGDVSIH